LKFKKSFNLLFIPNWSQIFPNRFRLKFVPLHFALFFSDKNLDFGIRIWVEKKCRSLHFSSLLHSFYLSHHRCTRVENPGEGVPEVFAKIPGGGQGSQEKLPGGGGGGPIFTSPPPPCVHLCITLKWIQVAIQMNGPTQIHSSNC